MILASQIPLLTERFTAATLAAIRSSYSQADGATDPAGSDQERMSLLVERLERLGYRVTLERVAA
jgi:hypothetical protein